MNLPRRRGRPPRSNRLHARGERRAAIDFPKLARALLEQAAMNEAANRQPPTETTPKQGRASDVPAERQA